MLPPSCPPYITAQTCQKIAVALNRSENVANAAGQFEKNSVFSFIDQCFDMDLFQEHYVEQGKSKEGFGDKFLMKLIFLALSKEQAEVTVFIFKNEDVEYVLQKNDGKVGFIKRNYTSDFSLLNGLQPICHSELLYELDTHELLKAIEDIVKESNTTEPENKLFALVRNNPAAPVYASEYVLENREQFSLALVKIAQRYLWEKKHSAAKTNRKEPNFSGIAARRWRKNWDISLGM